MDQLLSIPFHNQTLIAIEHDGQPYIAMRPIVENLGLDWKSQHVKITEKFKSVVVMITTTGSDGKQYEMLCLPLSKIAGFLYSINPSKVKPELRERVITYQEECDEVLFHHFFIKQQLADSDERNQRLLLEYQNRKLADYAFRRTPNYRIIALYLERGKSASQTASNNNIHVSTVYRLKKNLRSAGLLH